MFVSSRRHRATVPVDGSPAYTRRPRPGHHCQTRAPRRSTRGRGRIRVAEAPVGHQQPRAAAGAEPEFGRSPAKRCAPAAHLPTVCPSSSPSIEEFAGFAACVLIKISGNRSPLGRHFSGPLTGLPDRPNQPGGYPRLPRQAIYPTRDHPQALVIPASPRAAPRPGNISTGRRWMRRSITQSHRRPRNEQNALLPRKFSPWLGYSSVYRRSPHKTSWSNMYEATISFPLGNRCPESA